MKKLGSAIVALVVLMMLTFSITAENITQTNRVEINEIAPEDYLSDQNSDAETGAIRNYDAWSD